MTLGPTPRRHPAAGCDDLSTLNWQQGSGRCRQVSLPQSYREVMAGQGIPASARWDHKADTN